SNWNNAYKDIENNPDVWLEELEHGRPDRVRAFIFNTRRAPFDDIRVRQALNLLFDFNWVNKSLYFNEYKQINSFYPNTDLGVQAEETQPEDLRVRMRKADQLLKDAGWVVQNGQRVNEQSGEIFEFEVLLDNPNNEKLALALKQNLKRMGVEMQIRSLDTAAFRGRLNEYDFDMVLYYWLSSLSPGTEQYLYWSCEAANQPTRWNFAGICDHEIDSLSKNIAQAKTREELIASTRALDQKLLEGQYMIPLYYNPKDFVAYRDGITRPDTTPLYGMVVETWWTNKP
ncbi:MAG: ABC transporter substrate-binding protein, partial [Pseudomonadota bacterium]